MYRFERKPLRGCETCSVGNVICNSFFFVLRVFRTFDPNEIVNSVTRGKRLRGCEKNSVGNENCY